MIAEGMGKQVRKSLDIVLIALAVTATVAAGISIFSPEKSVSSPNESLPNRELPLPALPISIEGAPRIGSASARVALIEFSDFECPFCSRFARSDLQHLKKTYVDSGRAVLVFKHLPLEKIHPAALPAAQLAVCAQAQGKFWQLHDTLYSFGPALPRTNLVDVSRSSGLDATSNECASSATLSVVRKDQAEARALGLTGTPSFLVGTLSSATEVKVRQIIEGAQPASVIAAAIERLLTR